MSENNSSGNNNKDDEFDEYQACQLASWYPTFCQPSLGRKKGLTIQSVVVPVPDKFGEYLAQDGVQLPTGIKLSSCLGVASNNDNNDEWSSSSSDDADETKPRATAIDLTDLTQRLQQGIETLGGAVLPKTNWSAPRDAAWMNEGTLKCQTAGDVYLLLQSSDFVNSDVQLLQQQQQRDSNRTLTIGFHIVLRKWCQLHASHEFRCFVSHHRLVAISQRQTDQYFEHVVHDREDLQFIMEEFYQEFVRHKYANGKIGNYVIDVYIDKQDRVWIVDFNVFAERTDSLLFSWDELKGWTQDKPAEFRIIETAKEILPQSLNNYRAPVDTVHLAALTSASPDKFQAFMDLCQRPSEIGEECDSDNQ